MAIRLLTEARTHALEGERRLAQARIVAGEPGMRPAAASAELSSRLQGLEEHLGVAVQIDEKGHGKAGPVVRDAILAALAARGVRVVKAGRGKGGAALAVRGTASAEHSSSVSKRLHFARARGVFQVVRPSDGTVLVTVEKEVKGGGRNEGHAKDKALRALAKEVAGEVAGAVAGVLGGG